MKFIKSKSVNFSKYCFDATEEDEGPSQEEIRSNADKLIEAGRQAEAERIEQEEAEQLAQAQAEEARIQSVRDSVDNIQGNETPAVPQTPTKTVGDSFLESQQLEAQIKAKQAELAKQARLKAETERKANIGSANDTLGLDKSALNNDGLVGAATGDQEYAHLIDRKAETGKTGDIADEVATKTIGAGKGIANAFGSALSALGATNLGNNIKTGAANINENKLGLQAGDWADKHPVAAGAIGTGALIGAGVLGKKGYDLMQNKKQLKANAYYAFADGNINKDTLIGGPYATRKDAREAKPEAAHILKGSTLGAYGDFEIAA